MNDGIDPIWVGLIIFIVGPLIGLFRRRKPKVAKNPKVIARCPHCGELSGLERLRNFICHSCGGNVIFFDGIGSTQYVEDLELRPCPACGAENPENVVVCMSCGETGIG